MTRSQAYRPSTAGFTLIEILITLVIVSVAILSLGSFAVSIIDSGQQSRERLSAVHLAEQVLEFWQRDANDYVPALAPDCALTPAASAPSYPASSTCTPSTGVAISYTVVASVAAAIAPLPTSPNLGAYEKWASVNPTGTNPALVGVGTASPNPGAFSIRNMINYNLTGSPSPVVKVVTVSWSHKGGTTHSVYLTHLTVVQ